MSTNLVPAFAQQGPSPVFKQAFGAVPGESLADGIGGGYGILGYRGKVWSLRYNGENRNILRPDDGTPASYIDVIIVGQAKVKSKSYYPKWEEGSQERPLCASLDGVTPDADVTQRQSTACAICPRNEWKTGPDGKKKRECSDFKRLAVLMMPAQTKAMLGEPLMQPVFLRVPAASLQDLANFGKRMEQMGWHYASFITRISFAPEQSYPKMVFEAVKGLTDAEAPVVLPLLKSTETFRITGEDKVSSIPGSAHNTQAALAPPPPQTPKPEPAPETGLLDLTPNKPAAPPAQAATVATVPDTGETVESDAALDEEIKSLLSA